MIKFEISIYDQFENISVDYHRKQKEDPAKQLWVV